MLYKLSSGRQTGKKMKIGYLFPVVVGIAGVMLLVWFIASGAWAPGPS